MSENLKFLYKEEFWMVSAFINDFLIDGNQKSKEIEKLVLDKLHDLKDEDIYRKELKDDLIEMTKNISLTCRWVPYIQSFPYMDENSERNFNTIGYFQFDVEYFKDDKAKKAQMKPILIQQVPFIIMNSLIKYSNLSENEGMFLDGESPVYIFVTSNSTSPKNIVWNVGNIEKHKKLIGQWTEIYSGQWEDYSETLFNRRIENNLSNRLSELHFIRRNSAFIYMAEDNYENFFLSYMTKFVLAPIPQIRAVLFALRSINESLDLLFLKTQSQGFFSLARIEEKLKNLRLLRGLIQTNLSVIYNELDYNRRQHYSSVLKHLLNEFEIDNIVKRINKKFETIYTAMQDLYQKKNEENQQKTERGLNLLNLLFGAGILADLVGVIMIVFNLAAGNIFSSLLNGIVATIMVSILLITVGYYIYIKRQVNKLEIGIAVDGIIEDNKGNIVLIKRKYPPFQNYYALPGGAVEKGESLKSALKREIKEETNLDINIVQKTGIYKEEGRDPRGEIHSTVFKCTIISGTDSMRAGDDSSEIFLIPINKLKSLKLAFDHYRMLKDADIID